MRLRFSLASRLMLLPVALLPVMTGRTLCVWSLGEAVKHSAQLRNRAVLHDTRWCAVSLHAGVLSLVLLTLPASPVLQVKLCAWRMAMQLRDGKRVG